MPDFSDDAIERIRRMVKRVERAGPRASSRRRQRPVLRPARSSLAALQLEWSSGSVTSGAETLVEWDDENFDTGDYWDSGDPEVLAIEAGDYRLILMLGALSVIGQAGTVDVLIETDEGSPTEIYSDTITVSAGDYGFLLADLNSLDGTPLRVKVTPTSTASSLPVVQQIYGSLTTRTDDSTGTITTDLPIAFGESTSVEFDWLDDPPPGGAVAVPGATTVAGATVDADGVGGFSFSDADEVLPAEDTVVRLTIVDTWLNSGNVTARGQTVGITPVSIDLTLTLIKIN